jgi:uncharacterized membrane protein
MVERYRQQAIRVWTIGLCVVGVWLAAILAAPIARANGFTALSAGLYRFFSFLCHQMPERSFYAEGEPFGVCSRCFGVYAGLFVGFAVFRLWRRIDDVEPLSRFWLFLSLVPMGVDWSLTAFGIWENTHFSRLITGLILGFACATYIVPATVEITRNFTHRRRAA